MVAMKNKRKIITKLKQNIVWIIMIFILLVALKIKNQEIEIAIVSQPDSQIAFSSGQVLEQTWQANIKEITKIEVPYQVKQNYVGNILLKVYKDDSKELLGESKIWVELSENTEGVINFPFQSVLLENGKRYRIQLQYEEYDNDGVIYVDSGNDYAGCSVDGEDMNAAVSLHIMGNKTRNISWLVLTFFPFISFALFFMVVWKRKLEDTIGISMITTTIIIFIMGMFGALERGIFLTQILASVILGITIYYYNKNNFTVHDLISPGLFVYAVLVIFIIVNCNDLSLRRSDEFSHWGLSVKDMFCYNSLPKHTGTTVFHIYYPPFMPVIEYYFVYMNAFFADKFLYIGYQVMLISCLMPIYKSASKRSIMVIPSSIVMIAGLLCFYESVFYSIYVDAIMAVFVAYVLVCYYAEPASSFNAIRILGGLLAITYTKPTGAVLAGLITLIMIADTLLKLIDEKEVKKKNLKKLIWPCICTIFVCALYLGWQIYLGVPAKAETMQEVIESTAESQDVLEGKNYKENSVNSTMQEIKENDSTVMTITSASGFSFERIKKLLTNQGEEYQYYVIKHFADKILLGDSFTIGSISFSYMELLFILLIISWFLGYFILLETERKSLYRFTFLTTCAGILYISFLLLTYIFSFSEREAISLAHHERYVGTWICGVTIAFGSILLIKLCGDKQYCAENMKRTVIMICMLLIFVTPTENLINRYEDMSEIKEFSYKNEAALEVMRSFAARNESIVLLCDESSQNDYWRYQYAVCPLKMEKVLQEAPVEEWEQIINNCQYVFLVNQNLAYTDKYIYLFEEIEEVRDGAFYRVVNTEKGIRLRYIGSANAEIGQL